MQTPTEVLNIGADVAKEEIVVACALGSKEALDLADQYSMVACSVAGRGDALEICDAARQQRDAPQPPTKLQTREPVLRRAGKPIRQFGLGRREHIDGKALARAKLLKQLAALSQAPRNQGGSSETEVNEFAVIPSNRPSPPHAVTTVTPVG